MANDAWSLAPFAPERLDELVDLWVDSWLHTMPEIDFEGRRKWFKERICELHGSGSQTYCAFAKEDNNLVGFVIFNRQTHYLDQLAVAPRLFGSKLAVSLLTVAKQQSSELLELHVNQDNCRALRFYEREGFRRRAESINPRSGLKVWQMKWRG